MGSVLPQPPDTSLEPLQENGEACLSSSNHSGQTGSFASDLPNLPVLLDMSDAAALPNENNAPRPLFPPPAQEGVLCMKVDNLLLPIPDDLPAFNSSALAAAPSVSYLMRRARHAAPDTPPQPSDSQPTPPLVCAESEPAPAASASYRMRRSQKTGDPWHAPLENSTLRSMPATQADTQWDAPTPAAPLKAASTSSHLPKARQIFNDPWLNPDSPRTAIASIEPANQPAQAVERVEYASRNAPDIVKKPAALQKNADLDPTRTRPVPAANGAAAIPSAPVEQEQTACSRTLWRSAHTPKTPGDKYTVVPGPEDEYLLPLDIAEALFIPPALPVSHETRRPAFRPDTPWPRAHQNPAARRATLSSAARTYHTQPGPGIRRDRIMGISLVDDEPIAPSRLEGVALLDAIPRRSRKNIPLVDDETPQKRSLEGISLMDDADPEDTSPVIRVLMQDNSASEAQELQTARETPAKTEQGWGIGSMLRRMLGKVFGGSQTSHHANLLKLSLGTNSEPDPGRASSAKNKTFENRRDAGRTESPSVETKRAAPENKQSSLTKSTWTPPPLPDDDFSPSTPPAETEPDKTLANDPWDTDDDAPVWTPPAAEDVLPEEETAKPKKEQTPSRYVSLGGGVVSKADDDTKPGLFSWLSKLLGRDS